MLSMYDEPYTENGFFGEYRFLSNMFPVELVYRNQTFASSEHLYQWLKFIDLDPVFAERIRTAKDGYKAKRIAHEEGVPRHAMAPSEFADFRLECMRIAVDVKYDVPVMADWLLATGDLLLVEINGWGDSFFGVSRGSGANHLGVLLMRKRASLRLSRGR